MVLDIGSLPNWDIDIYEGRESIDKGLASCLACKDKWSTLAIIIHSGAFCRSPSSPTKKLVCFKRLSPSLMIFKYAEKANLVLFST